MDDDMPEEIDYEKRFSFEKFYENNDSAFARMWGGPIAAFNFTQVPNAIISCQKHLDITTQELVTLIQLCSFKFHPDSKVFPSITTLSRLGGNGYSTMQKRLKKLEQKGFIKREHRMGTSNKYNLEPMIVLLTNHLVKCETPPRNFKPALVTVPIPVSSLVNSKEDNLNILTSENTAKVTRQQFTESSF